MEEKGGKRSLSLDETHTKMLQNAVELGLDLELLCDEDQIAKLGLQQQSPKEDQPTAQDNNECTGGASNKEAVDESPKVERVEESHENAPSDDQQAGVEDRKTSPQPKTIQELLDMNKSRRRQGDLSYLFEVRDDLVSAQMLLSDDETKRRPVFPRELGTSWLDWKLSETRETSIIESDPLRQLLQPEHPSLHGRRLLRIDPAQPDRTRAISGLQHGAHSAERPREGGLAFPRERTSRREFTGEEAQVTDNREEDWEESLRKVHSFIQSQGLSPHEDNSFEEDPSRATRFKDDDYSDNWNKLSRDEDSYSSNRNYNRGCTKVYDKDYDMEVEIDHGEGEGLSDCATVDSAEGVMTRDEEQADEMADEVAYETTPEASGYTSPVEEVVEGACGGVSQIRSPFRGDSYSRAVRSRTFPSQSADVMTGDDILAEKKADKVAYETTPQSSGYTSPVEEVVEGACGGVRQGRSPFRVDSYSRAVRSRTFPRQTLRTPPQSPDQDYEDSPRRPSFKASADSDFDLDETEKRSLWGKQEEEMKHLQEQAENREREMLKLCNQFFTSAVISSLPVHEDEDLAGPRSKASRHSTSGLEEADTASQDEEQQEKEQNLKKEVEELVELCNRLFASATLSQQGQLPSLYQEFEDLPRPSSAGRRRRASDPEGGGTASQHVKLQEVDHHPERENKDKETERVCNLFFAPVTPSMQGPQSSLLQEVKDLPSPSCATNKHGASVLEGAEKEVQHIKEQDEDQHSEGDVENKVEEMAKSSKRLITSAIAALQKPPLSPIQKEEDLSRPSSAGRRRRASDSEGGETASQHGELQEVDHHPEGENKDKEMERVCNLFFAPVTPSMQGPQSSLHPEVKDLPSPSCATYKHSASVLEAAETAVQHSKEQDEHQHSKGDVENKVEKLVKLSTMLVTSAKAASKKPPLSSIQGEEDLPRPSSTGSWHYASDLEAKWTAPTHGELQEEDHHLEEKENKDEVMEKACNLFFASETPVWQEPQSSLLQEVKDLPTPSSVTNRQGASGLEEAETAVQHGKEQEAGVWQEPQSSLLQEVEDLPTPSSVTNRQGASGLEEAETAVEHWKEQEAGVWQEPQSSLLQEVEDLPTLSSMTNRQGASGLEEAETAVQHGKEQEAVVWQEPQSSLLQEVEDLPTPSSVTNMQGASGLEEAETAVQHGEEQEENQHLEVEQENKEGEMAKMCWPQ